MVISAGGAATRNLIGASVLQAREIAGAGLDVYQAEPRVPPELLQLDNVVLLPHVASATHETRRAVAERVLANLAGFFANGTVPVAVPMDA